MKTKLQKLKIECVKLAIKKKLEITPRCEGCGLPATTAHHIVRQANSNYLRCNLDNLISTCIYCHSLAHSRGDAVAFGAVILKRGKKWHTKLIEGARMIIKDNIAYWTKIKEDLTKNI